MKPVPRRHLRLKTNGPYTPLSLVDRGPQSQSIHALWLGNEHPAYDTSDAG